MKKLLLILLCLPMLFSSCQQNNPAPPAPPCDGDCGTIVNTPYPNGAYILQQGPNGLIMINTHFICRIIIMVITSVIINKLENNRLTIN